MGKTRLRIGSVCVAFGAALCPGTLFAQVVIAEVMYDYPGSDSKQEWVELFNAGGSPVDLSGWKVNDGSNHVLNEPPKNGGQGSMLLSPGAYAILADDAATFLASNPWFSGTVIDTIISAGNTSGSVSLVNADGATVDAVSYTKDTGAQGDGMTLHRVSVSGTLLSAGQPSPGTGSLVAATGAGGSTTSTTSATTETQQPNGAAVSSYVAPPVPTLFTDAGGDRTVIVAADTVFRGRAYNRSRETVDRVRFMWNFGDGSVAEGEAIEHHFEYPGRYAVVLDVAHDKTAASDRIVVTAEPAWLAFALLPDGSVGIENRSGRDLDLSRWRIADGLQSFALPESTFVLSGETLRFSIAMLRFRPTSRAELQYPNGVQACVIGGTIGDSSPVAPPVSAPSTPRTVRLPVPETGVSPPESGDAVLELPEQVPVAGVQTAAAASFTSDTVAWVLGTTMLSVAGGVAVYLTRRFRAGEWEIEELADEQKES